MSLAEYLINLRDKRGYSQRQLALKAGISNTEISRLEKGERKVPSLQTINKLSKALGVTFEDMLAAAGYTVKKLDKGTMIINETVSTYDPELNKDLASALAGSTHMDGSPLSDKERKALHDHKDDILKIIEVLIKK